MPDYRAYAPDSKGGVREVPVEEFAKFLGVSEFDADLLLKGMNITKTICATAGALESPPLIWNKNMPKSLVEFVADYVCAQLNANPAWSVTDFEWGLLYDGDDLKYKE